MDTIVDERSGSRSLVARASCPRSGCLNPPRARRRSPPGSRPSLCRLRRSSLADEGPPSLNRTRSPVPSLSPVREPPSNSHFGNSSLKSEARNPKSKRNPNPEARIRELAGRPAPDASVSAFGFSPSLARKRGARPSDFGIGSLANPQNENCWPTGWRARPADSRWMELG